ncbi:MAG TPA: chromosome segregation protein SMC [Nitrosospira sp.]|nr:chromosome segregation protein SMC [Nitrosospira sp.]
MRLSHIKLSGFKSFVDPTEIPTPGDLVGIVGPNGCGKSNVIDAVRWVLGESRASALRGESMQDVIFNGSGNRKAVGRASVELVFDNSLGKAAGQWSTYAQISIKRVLRRNGESSYHINNIHVRRRDVADIFLGTGVGGRGYAIIEQGMISRIIDAKPEELRMFLEETAGISRYRERRRETEQRLGDTSENLLRVSDICQELEKQLARLEEQAHVATRFRDVQGRLRRAQELLSYARRQEAAAQRESAEKELESLQVLLEAETARLHAAETRLEDKRAQHYASGDALHQAQGALYSTNAEIAHLEQQIQHLRENSQRVAAQISSVNNRIDYREGQAREAEGTLSQLHTELEQARQSHEQAKSKATLENEKLPGVEAAFRACQQKSAQTEHALLRAEQAGRLEENHRAYAGKTIQQLELRRTRLLTELSGLPAPEMEELSQLHFEAEISASELNQKQGALAEAESLLSATGGAVRSCVDKVRVAHQRIIQAEARLHALERLQHRLEGSDKLSAWLAKHQLDALPRLWQSIQIESGWEDALEAVLRERLNSAQLERLEFASAWVRDPPPAKWTVYEPTGRQVPNEQTGCPSRSGIGWRTLQSYLSFDNTQIRRVMEEWLSGVFAVESIEEGLARRTTLFPREMFATREGHIVTYHSLSYYSPDSQLHGVLGRQREIGQIRLELGTLKNNLALEQSSLDAAEESKRELGSSVSRLRFDIAQLQQQSHDIQMQRLKLVQLAERASSRRGQINDELAEIEQQMTSEVSATCEAETRLAQLKAEIETLREMAKEEKGATQDAERFLSVQRHALQNALREVQEALFREKTCHNKMAETENTINSIKEDLAEFRTQLQKLQAEQGSFDETELNSRLHEWLTLRGQREHALAIARNVLEEAARLLRNIEQERLAAEQKLHPLRESISAARLKEQEARIIENQFDEQLKESSLSQEELAQALGKTRPSALQAEIVRLDGEIKALGAVNLGALQELESARVRKGYLDSQLKDLREASDTLKDAIRRMDAETRERLLETVEKVNANLNEMFPTIFGGGQARLLLKGDEILDAGVQIIAQPPGKKNSSIQLLSGGEKALTALAFVFSLFQLNPAPFCLLDEVDAPLDDSNTVRFCNMVRKMARQTQFIFISHNKITMEMAQQLIGVTMQEKGVSRVVAVEMEDAARLGSTPQRAGQAW